VLLFSLFTALFLGAAAYLIIKNIVDPLVSKVLAVFSNLLFGRRTR
jgi:hypothetical protein